MSSFAPIVALGLLEDIVMWAQLLWWVWLILIAWKFYSWANEHLAFSPLLAITVAVILIYFLVIEYPLAGSALFLVSVLLFSGLVYMLPYVAMLLPFKKK